jgi:hypothetical protein
MLCVGVPIKGCNWVGPCGALVNYNDISSQLKKYSEETYFTKIPSSISMHGHSHKLIFFSVPGPYSRHQGNTTTTMT